MAWQWNKNECLGCGGAVCCITRRYFLPLWCFWWLRCLVTGGSCDLVTLLVRVGLSSSPPPPPWWWWSSEGTPLHLLTRLPAILASDSPPTGFYVASWPPTLQIWAGSGFENYHQLTFLVIANNPDNDHGNHHKFQDG